MRPRSKLSLAVSHGAWIVLLITFSTVCFGIRVGLSEVIGDPNGTALLVVEKVMENGNPLQAAPPLETIQQRFLKNFSLLDEKYKDINKKHVYPVGLSPRLEALQKIR